MSKVENLNSKIENSGSRVGTPAACVRDFTDLDVWQLTRTLRQELYRVVQGFPGEERYALGPQLRRAATLITANSAEDFPRYSFQQNIQFCRLARGSAYEVWDHLITVLNQGFISGEDHARNDALAQRVIRTLNGYIRSTQARQGSRSTRA